jgi:hypothetical protein
MHTLNKPKAVSWIGETAATGFEITAGDGALSGTMLLPASVSVATVGGPGNEFEAGGKNWPPAKPSSGVSGQWRLEVSPTKAQEYLLRTISIQILQWSFRSIHCMCIARSRYDLFISAWQPHDTNTAAAPAATLVSWPEAVVVGVQVRERLAVFVAAPAGMANVTSLDLRGGKDVDWGDTQTVTLHACGLQAGAWVAVGGKALGTVAAPSFCLVANVTEPDLEAGPLACVVAL